MADLSVATAPIVVRVVDMVRRWLVAPQPGVTSTDGDKAETVISPEYSALKAMSTMARFPWVWVCVRAVATDLSGLPLIAVGANGEPVDSPILDMMRQPSERCSGVRLRRQMLVDWLLTGNCYLWMPPGTQAVIRLHPDEMAVTMDRRTGMITTYVQTIGGQQYTYLPEEIFHVADVSWQTGVQSVIGESAIRALHDDLLLEMNTKAMAAKAAKRGRLEMLFSAKDSAMQLGQKTVDAIKAAFSAAVGPKGNGALVVGSSVEVQPLSMTPRAMEFAERSGITRDTILALFEVPPARAGLVTTNYGTAKTQMRAYWESLIARVQLFDDELSRIAGVGVSIRHDFTSVEALQVAQTERQMRAATWVNTFGALPSAAAKYEGFVDAPVDDSFESRSPRRPASEPEEPQKSIEGVIAAHLRGCAAMYEATADDKSAIIGARMFQIGQLRQIAQRYGLDVDLACAWAEEVGADTSEAVDSAFWDSAEDEVPDLSAARAFSRERAARLASTLRAMALSRRAA
jgi:HK97 family phage portal protein